MAIRRGAHRLCYTQSGRRGLPPEPPRKTSQPGSSKRHRTGADTKCASHAHHNGFARQPPTSIMRPVLTSVLWSASLLIRLHAGVRMALKKKTTLAKTSGRSEPEPAVNRDGPSRRKPAASGQDAAGLAAAAEARSAAQAQLKSFEQA